MKKTLLIAGALLALTASMATAGGINLSWTDCGAAGAGSKTSACANNAAVGTLVASAILSGPMHLMNGQTCQIDLQTTASALSPWWLMSAGGCAGRTGAATGNSDFTDDVLYPSCDAQFANSTSPGFNYSPGTGGPNRARMRPTSATAVAYDSDNNIFPEMYMAKVSISGARTVGTGACPGCLDGAVFVLNEIFITQPIGVGDAQLQNPAHDQCARWQASSANIPGGCTATPAKNATWGSVKALYR